MTSTIETQTPHNQEQPTQSQMQTQSIEISVDSSGDLDLERRIFRQVHSVGRQLSRLSDVMCLVIGKLQLDPALNPIEDPAETLSDFRQMRADIRKEMQERDERLLRSLQELRDNHPTRYASLVPQLRSLLDTAAPAEHG